MEFDNQNFHSSFPMEVMGVTSNETGYSKQKMKNLDFHNFIDRTQSIDTLATGIDSNQSPYDKLGTTV